MSLLPRVVMYFFFPLCGGVSSTTTSLGNPNCLLSERGIIPKDVKDSEQFLPLSSNLPMADIINRSRSSFQLSQTQGLEFFLRQFCMQPLPCLWYWAKRRDLFPIPILGHQVLHLHPFGSHVSSGLREKVHRTCGFSFQWFS